MRRHRGMTLVEILVVVAILGILAAIILPALTRAAEGQVPGPVASAPDDAGSAASSMTLIAISLVALLVVVKARRTGATLSVRDGKLHLGKGKG